MTVLTETVLREAEEQAAAIDLTDILGFQRDRAVHRLAYRVITVLGIETNYEGMTEIREVIAGMIAERYEDDFDDEL